MDRPDKKPIRPLIPEGNFFGDATEDEFFAEIDPSEDKTGVFKRFEFPSVPFSFTGNKDVYDSLLSRAQESGSSFFSELKKDPVASALFDDVLVRMQRAPELSRQIINHSLARSYVKDLQMVGLFSRFKLSNNRLETEVAKVALAWNELSDFYCLEGMLGGHGENNPFLKNGNHNLIMGMLDAVENKLPAIYRSLQEKERVMLLLRMSRIIERDYNDIKSGIEVLEHIHGLGEINQEEASELVKGLAELSKIHPTTNVENGKLYNSIIRFHNWLPLSLTKDGPDGSVYDSICAPTRTLEGMLQSDLREGLSSITDATSPKGVAIVKMVDKGLLADDSSVWSEYTSLQDALSREPLPARTLDLDDHAFYQGLAGGKWKGLKLLSDAKSLFGLNYSVPRSTVITTVSIEDALKKRGLLLGGDDLFRLSEDVRQKLVDGIAHLDLLDDASLKEKISSLGEKLIFRSSMYGEDGRSNFAGTYDSVVAQRPDDWNSSFNSVIASYFSEEAVSSREDLGLAHKPGIAVVVQELLSGTGGVIHLTREGVFVSTAASADDAVNGSGDDLYFSSIKDVASDPRTRFLGDHVSDLELLSEAFGDIDLEYVRSDDGLYFTQMRPKGVVVYQEKVFGDYDSITIGSIDGLKGTVLDRDVVVKMPFLGRENLADRDSEIMDFIRTNKDCIRGIAGNMPRVAHIPNKIEGHFRIPYITIGGDEE